MKIYNKEQDNSVENLSKFVGQRPEQNGTTHPKNYRHLSATTETIWPKVIKLPNIFLTKHEIEILKLGLSFIPTPKHNISELQTDIHNFFKKLRLTYHFRDSTYENKSILKKTSTFTPKANKSQDLETICKNLSETKFTIERSSDNIPNLRDGLNSLITKIRPNEIIIKPADKGSIVVLMTILFGNACLKIIYDAYFKTIIHWLYVKKSLITEKKYPNILTDNG